MSTEEPKQDTNTEAPSEEAAPTDPPMAEAAPPPEKEGPKINWEYRENLPINDRMREVINLTIKASECQLEVMRRKLKKLQYGS